MSNRAWLDGKFMPIEECTVSVLDRGFLFGDSTYEVIPVFQGIAFRQEQHLKRLDNSLVAAEIECSMSHDKWGKVIAELIDTSTEKDLSLYIQVTRGVAPRDHFDPKAHYVPTCLVMATPMKPVPDIVFQQGLSAIGIEDVRWHRCDIKTTSLLANVLAKKEALEQRVDEALLFRNGFLTETPSANVFIVKGRSVDQAKVTTPPCDMAILPGITREAVLEIAQAKGMCLEERAVSYDEVIAADEVWLSSSTRLVLPLTKLDGQAIGSGQPGPVWQAFSAWMRADIRHL